MTRKSKQKVVLNLRTQCYVVVKVTLICRYDCFFFKLAKKHTE